MVLTERKNNNRRASRLNLSSSLDRHYVRKKETHGLFVPKDVFLVDHYVSVWGFLIEVNMKSIMRLIRQNLLVPLQFE